MCTVRGSGFQVSKRAPFGFGLESLLIVAHGCGRCGVQACSAHSTAQLGWLFMVYCSLLTSRFRSSIWDLIGILILSRLGLGKLASMSL